MKHHPDKGGDPEEFKRISRAYEVLVDPRKRAVYDEYGEEVSGWTALTLAGGVPPAAADVAAGALVRAATAAVTMSQVALRARSVTCIPLPHRCDTRGSLQRATDESAAAPPGICLKFRRRGLPCPAGSLHPCPAPFSPASSALQGLEGAGGDCGGGGGAADILSEIFGGGRRRGGGPSGGGPRRGKDAMHPLEVSLEDLYAGAWRMQALSQAHGRRRRGSRADTGSMARQLGRAVGMRCFGSAFPLIAAPGCSWPTHESSLSCAEDTAHYGLARCVSLATCRSCC